jgi:cytosine/adenosine deaminase-related metal-dependent hydrolase
MILLRNGTFIDWQTLEFRQADILVEEGPEGKLLFRPDPSQTGNAKTLDCSGKLITRSFANAHHHAYSALATGMPPPAKDPENFSEILQYIWWNLDKALDPEMIRLCGLVTAMACARNGVTYVIDHHASPFAVEGSLGILAAAFEEVGVGHLLCYEISDRDGLDIAQKGLEETAAYLQKRQGLVGLHASFTVGNSTLKQSVDLARKTNSGIHIHVAEDKSDEKYCMRKYNMRVIERLELSGALQFSKTILAHCLHLDDLERALVSTSPAWVVQNPESNMNNSVGFFTSRGLGPRILLGTDGMHSDMLRSAQAACFSGHNYDVIDDKETYRRFRNVHHYLKENNFPGDGENNLVVLDYKNPTPIESSNFPGHFLFGFRSADVCHVISSGKLIVEDGSLFAVNEKEILAEARVQAARLWSKMR